MAVDHVKSTPITNLDSVTAYLPNTNGEGGAGTIQNVSGSCVGVASSSINATYRFVRVPTTAKIKKVMFQSQAQAAGATDIGVYYPTTGKTGKADLAANAISQALFASAVALTSLSQPTDVTNESGSYTADLMNQPLWQAAGLASDPGGYFDIVGTLTTALTTGTGIMGVSVDYVE